jgi:hypothetical protein
LKIFSSICRKNVKLLISNSFVLSALLKNAIATSTNC